MKLQDDDHRELLEEIFTPDADGPSLSSAEVVLLVESARQSRERGRRRVAIAVTAAVIALGAWISMRPSIEPSAKPDLAASLPRTSPEKPVAKADAPVAPPRMERIDDETMLSMLKDQPTALVRWPDGRQTLLLLMR